MDVVEGQTWKSSAIPLVFGAATPGWDDIPQDLGMPLLVILSYHTKKALVKTLLTDEASEGWSSSESRL